MPDLALFSSLQNGVLRPPEAGLAGDFFGIGRGRGGLWCNVRGSREISPGDPPRPLFVLACSDGDNSKGRGGGERGRRCSSTTASRCACQRQLKAPGRSTCRKGGATGGRWADGCWGLANLGAAQTRPGCTLGLGGKMAPQARIFGDLLPPPAAILKHLARHMIHRGACSHQPRSSWVRGKGQQSQSQ